MILTERTCKWPIGDPATDAFWFCGHEAEPGKPYCKTHINSFSTNNPTQEAEKRAHNSNPYCVEGI